MLPTQLWGEVVQYLLHCCELQHFDVLGRARLHAFHAGLVKGPTLTSQGSIHEDMDIMRDASQLHPFPEMAR